MNSVYGGVVESVLRRALKSAMEHDSTFRFGRPLCCGFRPGAVFPAIFSGRTDGRFLGSGFHCGNVSSASSVEAGEAPALHPTMSLKIMNAVWNTPCETHTQKLVLLKLADNANDAGVCWPSVANIASHCDLTEEGVRNQIKKLAASGLLEVERGHGRGHSNRYSILPGNPNGIEVSKIKPQRQTPFPVEKTPTPLAKNPNAVGGNHNRTIKEPSGTKPSSTPIPPKGEVRAEFSSNGIALSIYEAYPHHVAKPSALRAITRALRTNSGEFLLHRTKQFAALWKVPQSQMQYCPYPATWFNQERFKDDPATWRGPKVNGHEPLENCI
jgi:Helix-turn-helix domain